MVGACVVDGMDGSLGRKGVDKLYLVPFREMRSQHECIPGTA